MMQSNYQAPPPRMVRRKARVRDFKLPACQSNLPSETRRRRGKATVTTEVRPVGKNMANQAAVHNAFLPVLNELKTRYQSEGRERWNPQNRRTTSKRYSQSDSPKAVSFLISINSVSCSEWSSKENIETSAFPYRIPFWANSYRIDGHGLLSPSCCT
jgi:hypothetical protein